MSATISPDAAWRDYWKTDRLASCLPESQKAASDIAGFWRMLLAKLPDGSAILDIATGNGAVLAEASIAADASSKRFDRVGVDLADIDPHRYISDPDGRLAGVTFLGGVAAEALPFPEAHFDCVVSQYGLEYAELCLALDETARVLRPGGKLHWLAHSAKSAVVAQNHAQICETELLLAEDGPLTAMRRFVAAFQSCSSDVRRAHYKALRAVESAQKTAAHLGSRNIVDEVTSGLAIVLARPQAYRARDLERMLSDSERRLAAHRTRMQSLVTAALNESRLEAVCCLLGPPTWTGLEIEPFYAGKSASLVGLAISARRTSRLSSP